MKTILHYDDERNQRLFEQWAQERLGERAHDEMIRLKIDHSNYVLANAIAIATDVKNIPEGIDFITWMALNKYIALFHDFGRVLQYERQNSFEENGKDKPRHAELSIEALFGKDGVIRTFIETDEYDEFIRKAVHYHGVNLTDIPNDLTELERILVDIIRDADKIDIYRIGFEYSRKAVFYADSFEGYEVSDELYDSIMNDKVMKYLLTGKNPVHNMIGKLSFVLDLNFSTSYRIAKSYMPRLYNLIMADDLIPETRKRVENIYQMLYAHLEQKLVELEN